MATRDDKAALIVEHCRKLNTAGLNQGTSGNISIRHEDGFLISPTATAYEAMTSGDIVFVGLDGAPRGSRKPSSEWRFHRDILAARGDVEAVVHAHPTHCTALAILGRGIPAVHYMVAIFGGVDVRCAGYALYGSQALSDQVVAALQDRTACLLAHHGMIAVGGSVEAAFWRAEELEALAAQYLAALQVDEAPPELSSADMAAVLAKISGYGRSDG